MLCLIIESAHCATPAASSNSSQHQQQAAIPRLYYCYEYVNLYIDCVRIAFGIVQRQQIKMLIRSSCWPEFPFLLFPRNA